ncbi:4-hydroxythreonine-4-phosphate dehydrogenase PdxA [Caldivirga sp. MU80]|uniref:4-hydroxythreonine-4-phosphate dehydrogenase PdxA n=1 Tax=Caldivirga sp. MU80 TaxID=1650354 RepID=UPI000B004563|nr:4-hydroxythreonine-4-phosphate dehydrogenase PdxA [Caldivirga sp. MU80]
MNVRVGVTLGDPAGVGYEVVAKALPKLRGLGIELTLIGNLEHFKSVISMLKINETVLDGVRLIDIPGGPFEFGKVQEEAGRVSLESVIKAVNLAMAGEVDAIATAPINKEAWFRAGSSYIDHTTLLQALTKSRLSLTVFETRRLRVMFLTRHMPLAEAIRDVKRANVLEGIINANRALKALGVRRGRIAVAALNPHAGEGGLLGREEIDEIAPAVEEARVKYGIDAHGPISADSVFYLAAKGQYDIVLSLYHDQGHIAAKMYDFRRTISLTLGLPFLRTSVDHGTAYDIAGKGVADETSMLEAIRKAAKYAQQYKKRWRIVFGEINTQP